MRTSDLPEELRREWQGPVSEEDFDDVVDAIIDRRDRLTFVGSPLPANYQHITWSGNDVASARSFLDTAEAAGARMLLFRTNDLSPAVEAADGVPEALRKMVEELEQDDEEEANRLNALAEAVERAAAAAIDRADEVGAVSAVFFADGTAVAFEAEATWFREITDVISESLEEDGIGETIWTRDGGWVAPQRPPFEPPADDAKRRAVVVEVGSSRDFTLARNQHERVVAAKAASASFAQWSDQDARDWEFERWLGEVLRDAQDHARDVSLPLIENEWAQRAHRMVNGGETKQTTAARLGLAYSRFSSVVARYAFDPDWRDPS